MRLSRLVSASTSLRYLRSRATMRLTSSLESPPLPTKSVNGVYYLRYRDAGSVCGVRARIHTGAVTLKVHPHVYYDILTSFTTH